MTRSPAPASPAQPGLLTPLRYHAPPGPPVALGAALAIWLFAQADLMVSLMALLVAAWVGAGYLRARRDAREAREALSQAQARLAALEAMVPRGLSEDDILAAGAEMQELRRRMGAA